LLVSNAEVMINRDNWGHSYLTVRGEILGFVKDGLLRTKVRGSKTIRYRPIRRAFRLTGV